MCHGEVVNTLLISKADTIGGFCSHHLFEFFGSFHLLVKVKEIFLWINQIKEVYKSFQNYKIVDEMTQNTMSSLLILFVYWNWHKFYFVQTQFSLTINI